eukprot:scaffold1809_cov386-Prasinococcus_capsulatus_cf.AAC.48
MLAAIGLVLATVFVNLLSCIILVWTLAARLPELRLQKCLPAVGKLAAAALVAAILTHLVRAGGMHVSASLELTSSIQRYRNPCWRPYVVHHRVDHVESRIDCILSSRCVPQVALRGCRCGRRRSFRFSLLRGLGSGHGRKNVCAESPRCIVLSAMRYVPLSSGKGSARCFSAQAFGVCTIVIQFCGGHYIRL